MMSPVYGKTNDNTKGADTWASIQLFCIENYKLVYIVIVTEPVLGYDAVVFKRSALLMPTPQGTGQHAIWRCVRYPLLQTIP